MKKKRVRLTMEEKLWLVSHHEKNHKITQAKIFWLKAFVEADLELEIKKNKKGTFNHESRCP